MNKRIAVVFVALLKDSSGFSPPIRTSVNAVRTHDKTSTTRPSTEIHSQPVQRVAIVGAGIAGLSLAHALLAPPNNNNLHIDIFDSRSELDENTGSGVQLTGGLVALNKISSKLYRQVADAGLPFESVTSRCKPWFGSNIDGSVEKGWKLLDLDVQKAMRDDATERKMDIETDTDDYTLVMENGEVVAYTIMRGTLQRILYEELMQEHGVQVEFNKKLSDLSYADGIMCQFNNEDTTTGPYDLVVGCDGIQSAVKQYIDTGAINEESKSSSSAIYSGIRITFAIQDGVATQDASTSESNNARFTQYFGDGAYALTSMYGTGKDKPLCKGAFLIYADENYIGPFKRKNENVSVSTADKTSENVDWTQDNRIPKEHISECISVLKSSSIPGNAVANIVQSSTRFFDLGVYFHNPLSWNGWVREFTEPGHKYKTGKFAVLTGDAAHAMPPFLGQGANQALQDSYVLASKIHQYNQQVQSIQISSELPRDSSLNSLLKEYEHKRWLPTASITAKAAFLGYLETGSDCAAMLQPFDLN
eukprot:scaffold49823_cov73-Cyclotella_meneghiniana.AAC.7